MNIVIWKRKIAAINIEKVYSDEGANMERLEMRWSQKRILE